MRPSLKLHSPFFSLVQIRHELLVFNIRFELSQPVLDFVSICFRFLLQFATHFVRLTIHFLRFLLPWIQLFLSQLPTIFSLVVRACLLALPGIVTAFRIVYLMGGRIRQLLVSSLRARTN